MEIKVNPADMTQAQREYVAGFILGYPDVNCEIAESTPTPCVELAQLHHEHVTTMPAASFTVDPVAAAFGSAPVPLPPGAISPTSTPSIAVPPPPAPTVPTLQTPGLVSLGADAVPVDGNGLPWDARIHAESKAKIADGSWRSKRNLDPTIKASVEAELRQVMGAPAAIPLAVPTVTTQVPAPPVTASSPTTIASPPAAQAPDARQVFVQLVGRSAAAISAGKLTQAEVTACCVAAGVPMLPLLANRLDLVESVAAAIDAIVASRA